jgi:hypothetical protein
MSRLREALDQIDFARRYTIVRIDTVPQSQWLTMPPGCVTHMAWQVGHLATSEYRLCLLRLRPRTAADERLIPDAYIAAFSFETDPVPDPAAYPPMEEVRSVFDRVHARVLEEIAAYPDADLDLPPLRPHPLFDTRIAGLRYAPLHEMIHCGQIALIRRMLGQKPIW